MFFLFFYAWSQGDVARLTQGYDVSGNICGKVNEAIDGVPLSGVDMTPRPFMYIDLIRTAQILGGEALDAINDNVTFTDKSRGDKSDKLLFCLEDSLTGTSTTAAAAAATTAGPTTTAATAAVTTTTTITTTTKSAIITTTA